MNPESRIKLLQSLEEIKFFHSKNYDSRLWKFSAWGGIVFYVIICISYSVSVITTNPIFILFLLLPVPLISVWLLFRYKFDVKYKILATAILELGSIAQEDSAIQQSTTNEKKVIVKPKKQTTKQKKK